MTTPRARTSSSTFRMECAIAVDIAAPIEKIWELLSNACSAA